MVSLQSTNSIPLLNQVDLLQELERRTGALSKRAKRQHQNPIIHSRMAAAIKASKQAHSLPPHTISRSTLMLWQLLFQDAKNTEAAKLKVSQNQKRFFQDPENRRMRGLQMKGTGV